LRRFRYDGKHDLLRCPRGKILRPTRRVEHGRSFCSKAATVRATRWPRSVCRKGRANKAVVVSDDHPALLRRAEDDRDEWLLQHRYMQIERMAELTPPLIDADAAKLPPSGGLTNGHLKLHEALWAAST
jgi:hypothetical protein